MAQVTISIQAESNVADAVQVTQDAIDALEKLLPYLFDNVIVTSRVEMED